MEKNDNWKGVFESIFGRKEIVSATLTEIEFIRNKIAHNRKATQSDINIIKSSYTKILNTIGEEKFNSLVLTHISYQY
ncbi:Swt1 family HEPN domain-containing protein [Nostoc sp.]